MSKEQLNTTASRKLNRDDVDEIIRANHATVPIQLTVPSDLVLGITNNDTTYTFLAYQKGDATVSFVAGDNVTLVGTPVTSTKNGKPIIVWRIGVNGPNTEWGYA